MSLYDDLTDILTPYADKINQNTASLNDLRDDLDNLDVSTDTTLTQAGMAADAKAVGDIVSSIQEEIEGQESQETLTEVTGVNFAENATAYKSGAPYRTYYMPVSKGAKYIIAIDNAGNSNVVETRYAFSADVPAVGIVGRYIDKSSTPKVNSSTYTYTATDDGYFGVAYYYNQYTTLSAKSMSGGINQRLVIVEDIGDGINDRLDDISDTVSSIQDEIEGQESQETLTEVTGVNFAENATAYKSGAPYRTYYMPVSKGAKYIIAIDNAGNPNAVETRYAFSADVPAVGIVGRYIDKSSTLKNGQSTYTYTATDNGYLGIVYYWEQYVVLSVKSMSGGIDQRLTIVEGISGEVDDVNDRLDDISDTVSGFSGDTVQLENKTYWGGSIIGETTESKINIKSPADSGFAGAYVELPCGQTLRLVGAGVSTLTRLYFVFDANTEILIDVSDVSQNEKAELHYLSYEIDTHIYINCRLALLHEITVIEDITKHFGDEIASPYKMGTILNLNGAEYIRHAVKSMSRATYGGRVPAVFLHFSDIHGDVTNLKRILDFSNEPSLKSVFSDVICSGDIVPASLTDGMTWYSGVSGSEKILLVPGNHDSVYGSETSVTTATKQNVYEALIASRVDGWNVSQPNNASTEYLSYYFKDYTNPKLRVIFLDTNGHGDENYLANENTWLVSVLESAKTAGLSVVCVNHFIFANTGCSVVPCSFSPRVPQRNEGSWIIPSSFISSVEDFISGGGDFVCWLGGHGHQDHVLLHNNGHQLCIGVSLATYDTERSKYGDDQRIFGTKSQDLFNVIAVDTYSKHISILRVGCDLTRLMNSKRHLCIDYSNRTVIWND